jgi:hypothetical protein
MNLCRIKFALDVGVNLRVRPGKKFSAANVEGEIGGSRPFSLPPPIERIP